jgi:transposase
MLTNARDAKGYKARKTDVIDAEWLADLLRHRLLKPRFIPPLPIRELRDLTRYRESLVREQTALANRIQKLLESANLKLGQVASDALGASGKRMLRAVAAGETNAEQMSHLAQGLLKRKQPQLRQALEGRFTHAQRWILTELLDQYEQVEAALQRVAERIRQEVDTSTDPKVTVEEIKEAA